MALTINTNIKNDADGHLIDAKNVKGTYVVVEQYEDLANLPSACVVRGSLAFCIGQTTMYIYDYTDSWHSLGEIKGSPHTININSNFDVSQTYTFTFQWLTHDWEAVTFNTNIYFSDGTVLSFGENGTANSSSANANLLMIVVYQNKQYLANLTIDLASQSDNATLSFQELQAGSGGGTTTTITPELYTFTFVNLMAGPLFLYMTASQYNQLVQVLSQAGYTISSPSDIENLYNNGTLLERLTGLGAISLYKMGGSVDGDLLAGYEIDQNTGSITVKYFGNDGTLNTSTCTAQDINASTLSIDYVSQTISGGGSSGEGGSIELKSNVYTLKFSSNNTYEYIDSNEETQTTSLPMIWGITFEAKDIVNRFNAIIDEFNSTSGTSIAHITSENEIATTIKQIITMMIAGNMNNIQFGALFSKMLVYLANGEEQTSDEIYENSLNKLYRMFGSTKGSTGEDHLENSFLANTPIVIVYGMLGGGELAPLDIEKTGNYQYFCLKDTYELELINETPFEATGSGSGSGDSVSGGSGKLYMYDFRAKLYDYNGNEVLNSERQFRLGIYESNFERFKTQASQLGLTLNTPQDLVTLINNFDETTGNTEPVSMFGFLTLIANVDLKYFVITATNASYVELINWSFVGGFLFTHNMSAPEFQIADLNEGNEYYRGINTMNSCTLTEYGTSGSGSGDSEPTLPERFSIAQNLVVNMNGEQYKPNQANWSGSNNDNIRQFKVGSSVAGLTDIQALLSHLTGNPTYDVYNATKPTPCFVFCTESNICWKLQYDGETNGLRAYRVNNFPFAIKPKSETHTVTSWTSDNNIAPFTYKANITATNTIGADTIVELVNNNAVAFATYGFSIGDVTGQVVTIYSIGQPSANIDFLIKVGE